eukprot:UN22955
MEYLKYSLEEVPKPIADTNWCRKLFRHMMMGLQYLHTHRVTHADIKPANLLLTDFKDPGILKVADFGVSRILDNQSYISFIDSTPAYQAPEELNKSGHFRPWPVDIWACGVVLYEMVTGEQAFAPQPNQTAANPYTENRRRILNHEPDYSKLDDDLASLLKGMLIKNPTKRIKFADIIKHPWVTNKDTMEWRNSIEQQKIEDFQDFFKTLTTGQSSYNLLKTGPSDYNLATGGQTLQSGLSNFNLKSGLSDYNLNLPSTTAPKSNDPEMIKMESKLTRLQTQRLVLKKAYRRKEQKVDVKMLRNLDEEIDKLEAKYLERAELLAIPRGEHGGFRYNQTTDSSRKIQI